MNATAFSCAVSSCIPQLAGNPSALAAVVSATAATCRFVYTSLPQISSSGTPIGVLKDMYCTAFGALGKVGVVDRDPLASNLLVDGLDVVARVDDVHGTERRRGADAHQPRG